MKSILLSGALQVWNSHELCLSAQSQALGVLQMPGSNVVVGSAAQDMQLVPVMPDTLDNILNS